MSDKAHRSTFKLSIILSLITFSTFLVVPNAMAAGLQHATDNSAATEQSSSPTTVADSGTSRTTDSERSEVTQTPADKSSGGGSQAGSAKTPSSTTNGTTALTPN